MSFEHNDIVFDNRLMAALGSSEMGFDHNDSVTVDRMNAAIAAGGGGGGDYKIANVTIVCNTEGYAFDLYVEKEDSDYTGIFDTGNGAFNYMVYVDYGASVTVKLLYSGDSVLLSPYNVVQSVTGDAVYDSDTGLITVTGDCTITGYMDD